MNTSLRRTVGLPGAVLLGLGSMVGTGVFVSIGIAAEAAGAAVVATVVVAALLALANGLSSAQLAAAHPVSGGTYEYGYRFIAPVAGFAAGWMFLCAKSASAATAALGLAGYLLEAVPALERLPLPDAVRMRVLGALLVLTVTAVVAGGIRRSNAGNALLVAVTFFGLGALVVTALPTTVEGGTAPFAGWMPSDGPGWRGFLEGCALMFVAFTGYGRVATLGEEVRDPARVIPRAILATLAVVTLVYVAVALVGVSVLGAEGYAAVTAATAAPLEAVARSVGGTPLGLLVAFAAATALAGVLLNLVLGLSRVALAMARRGDAPTALARVDAERGSPTPAVWGCGGLITALALIGDIRLTWSFSAFTVLIYYAMTNLAALRMPAELRRVPAWVPGLGLIGCLSLGVQIDPSVTVAGVGVLAAGLIGRRLWGRAAAE